jgi:N-acetylmuramoyl-L-alanine amidase
MGRKLLFLLGFFIGFAVSGFAANKFFTLVIDAGHGGHDTGAMGAISKEKDINLKVALAFGKYVEENCPGVKVIYTRKTDVFIPLMERANIANRNNADLFISVHTNALPEGKIARGFETYTLGMHRAKDNLDVAMRENSVISMEPGYKQTYQGFDPKSSESYIMFEFIQDKNMSKSVELAKDVQNSVCSSVGVPDKGVHQAGFLVLRETSMPSCLIELGFITTPDEEQSLNNNAHVDAIARAIYQGFVQYKNKFSNQLAIPYKVQGDSNRVDVPQIVQQPYRPVRKSTIAASTHKVKTVTRKEASSKKEVVPFDAPVFKVQIFTSSRVLREDDSHFKGLTGTSCLKDGNVLKYMVGSSTNYNEIYRLRKSILDKFPDAYIIAVKGDKVVNVNDAIQEFLKNKKK